MSQKIDFTTLGFANYRDTEQATEKTWLNGETIYTKVLSVNGTIPVTLQHNISNLGVVVNIRVMATYASGEQRTIPWLFNNAGSYGSADWAGGFYINSTNIAFQIGSSLANTTSFFVVIEYTKTA